MKVKLDSQLAVRSKIGEIVKERRKDTEKYGKEISAAERAKQNAAVETSQKEKAKGKSSKLKKINLDVKKAELA